MKKGKTMRQMASVFLAMLLCMSCLCSPMAFAAEADPTSNPNDPQLAEESSHENEPPLDEDPAYMNESPLEEIGTGLSDAAQVFIDTVAALDQDAILSTANAGGLAHRAWEQDQGNEALKAALDEAVIASDEAAVQLYAAEDLFYELTEGEQNTEAVQTAFNVLMALVVTMQNVMEHPAEPSTGGDEPPLEEIAAILYDALPEAPTGSYRCGQRRRRSPPWAACR